MGGKKKKPEGALATNRKARYLYSIEDSLETGIALKGTEVKSIRQGKANLSEAYAQIREGEVFVENMHVSPYEQGNIFNVDPLRRRKLLLHKAEIRRLKRQLDQKGFTLVPLKLYLKNGKVKLELGVAKGKKLYDKRESIAKRDSDRRLRKMGY